MAHGAGAAAAICTGSEADKSMNKTDSLNRECKWYLKKWKGEPIPCGQSIITSAYALKAKSIIHTVGPDCRNQA